MLRAERLVLRQFFTFAMAFLLLCLGACEQNSPPSAQALKGEQLDVKAAPGKSPKGGFHHTDITGSSLKPVLNLPDRSGSAKQVADFQGKILLVFFGFTHSPMFAPAPCKRRLRRCRS